MLLINLSFVWYQLIICFLYLAQKLISNKIFSIIIICDQHRVVIKEMRDSKGEFVSKEIERV